MAITAAQFESTVGILFNRRVSSIGSIQLDASVRETHTSSAQVTEHPVEDGSNISDHVIQRPDSITIEGVVSNTTLVFPQGLGLIAPAMSLARTVDGITNDLAQTAYLGLLELIKGKQSGLARSISLVKIVTKLRTYENMIIENVTVNRDSSSANALFFTCTAREIKVVKTALANITASATNLAGAGKQTKGKQTTSPASSAVETSTDSSASKITGGGVAL